ncbi:MAG: hypothetical protein SCH39_05135 [Methanosarcinales archaeon]|nr:hypothetical protein [ANME-2 cluster archaeon]MDF1531095.1 hypothetical protein [ANME-2 cluster archaeon]MDW7775710.1 hypothetical protein [Methanosarcinales archaeon]
MSEIIPFAIGTVVGVFMVIKPNFVLFKPSRKGSWLAKLIGEDNWSFFVQVIGGIGAILSASFLYLEM